MTAFDEYSKSICRAWMDVVTLIPMGMKRGWMYIRLGTLFAKPDAMHLTLLKVPYVEF